MLASAPAPVLPMDNPDVKVLELLTPLASDTTLPACQEPTAFVSIQTCSPGFIVKPGACQFRASLTENTVVLTTVSPAAAI